MIHKIFHELSEKGIRSVKELPLHTVCTFRIGGIVDLGIYPHNEDEFCSAVALLREREIPFQVIGKGSNLLFGDGRLRGALILTDEMDRMERKGNVIWADCGVSLAALASYAAKQGLTGLEFARGIPGTVGGAMFMNAGAYGSSMDQIVARSRALDRKTGEILTLTEHGFGYRKSVYMERSELICLGAELTLKEGDQAQIEETMRELSVKRKNSQPLEYPSAGSYFKRPEGHFAGKLIEDAGLKGFSVGKAEISRKHAGFLINRGGATAVDVLAVENAVRQKVWKLFGVTLEREVRWIPTEEERG